MAPSVLHVSETVLGGVGAVIADLAAAERSEGWRVCVAAPSPGVGAPEVDEWFDWQPGARPGPAMRRTLPALRRIVAAADPDLVHLHSSMAGMCGRLVVRRRRPTLFQPHSWSFFAVTGAARTGAVAWERQGARWADAVLCVSEDERRAGERLGIRARYEVIANGVDLDRFRPADDAARVAARRQLRLPDTPLAVCVGRLHRQKGQHALLDAWPAVIERVPTAQLALVGDGPDRASLEERRSPRTVLVGHTTDVDTWVAAADVVVQPSVWEGMSLSLLEAMATGRSVVVTDVPGMAEVVVGGAGCVVPAGQPAALGDAVAARLLDPALAAREGAAARATVEQRHDLRRQRAAVIELSRQLTAR